MVCHKEEVIVKINTVTFTWLILDFIFFYSKVCLETVAQLSCRKCSMLLGL